MGGVRPIPCTHSEGERELCKRQPEKNMYVNMNQTRNTTIAIMMHALSRDDGLIATGLLLCSNIKPTNRS